MEYFETVRLSSLKAGLNVCIISIVNDMSIVLFNIVCVVIKKS